MARIAGHDVHFVRIKTPKGTVDTNPEYEVRVRGQDGKRYKLGTVVNEGNGWAGYPEPGYSSFTRYLG